MNNTDANIKLASVQEVVGSNPTEGKICFSHFTPFYEVEWEELFCKTNLKQKCIEINKNKNTIFLDLKIVLLKVLIDNAPTCFH